MELDEWNEGMPIVLTAIAEVFFLFCFILNKKEVKKCPQPLERERNKLHSTNISIARLRGGGEGLQ